jgi:hypothetical protein
MLGKVFLLGVALSAGYFIGYNDARKHSEHFVTRSVQEVRDFFGGDSNRNDVDAMMNRIEGKN